MTDSNNKFSRGDTDEWLALAAGSAGTPGAGNAAPSGSPTSSPADATTLLPGQGALSELPTIGGTPSEDHVFATMRAADAPDTHRTQPKPKKPSKAPQIALGVFVFLLLAIYGAGVWAFSNICYPNTFVADTDVSLMRRPTAISRIKSSAQGYKLVVSGNGFEWSYVPESATDIVDAEAAVEHVLSANEPLKWPVRLFNALQDPKAAAATKPGDLTELDVEDIELPETFDTEGFKASLVSAIEAYNAERTGTFDGPGAYDAEAGKLTLEKALSNRKLDPAVVEKAALLAISQLSKDVEIDDACYAPLANGATDKQLQQAIDAANELLGTNVNLKMGGATVATLDGATLVGWMTFDEALKPTLNTEVVSTWVSDLAKAKLDTKGAQRIYTRPDGKQVNVSGGSYGWVSDEAALVQLLNDAVANKQTGDIEVPVKQKAAKFVDAGQPDWDAYIDIDLSEQYARYYDASGNVIWESGIISGNPAKGYETPTGVYQINSNGGASELIGLDYDRDGEPDYRTPVNYWMPFIGNAVGLHDANWQYSSSFANPGVLNSVGSHGCVNLPPAKAQELHNLISVGLCVVTHY